MDITIRKYKDHNEVLEQIEFRTNLILTAITGALDHYDATMVMPQGIIIPIENPYHHVVLFSRHTIGHT